MFKNNPIRNSTETTGFLLIITKIPQKIDANETRLNKLWLEPLVNVSFKRYKSNMKKKKKCFSIKNPMCTRENMRLEYM